MTGVTHNMMYDDHKVYVRVLQTGAFLLNPVRKEKELLISLTTGKIYMTGSFYQTNKLLVDIS